MPTTTHTVTISQALQSTASGLLVLDSAANIAAALPNAGLLARVSSFTVTATAAAPALLSAAQLLALAGLGVSLHAPAGALELNTSATLTASQLSRLETLPGFVVGSSGHVTLSDTVANISGLLTTHPAYFAQASGIMVSLDGSSLGAYQAIQLNGLATHGKTLSFVTSPGHTVLTIAASAHDLGTDYAGLNALGQRQALSFSLTNDGTSVGANDAAGLVGLNGFAVSAHNLSVADSGASVQSHAAQIFGHGFSQIQIAAGTFAGNAQQLLSPTLHFANGAAAVLGTSTTQTGAGAAALAALPGFSIAGGATLAVADTAAALASTAPSWLHLASAAALTGDATVPAATGAVLAQISGILGSGFSLAGHSLTVADTAVTLIALPQAVTALATTLALGADATVTAGQLTAFAALPHVSLAGHMLSVADNAANLVQLAAPAAALASAEILNVPSIVSAGVAAQLAAFANLSLGSGASLTVQDSVANLIALGQGAPSITRLVALAPGSNVTITAAQGHALASIAHFSSAGASITINDSIADLASVANVGWQSVDSSVHITDTAADLAASAGSLLVQSANAVSLAANAQIGAAAAAQIASIPNFSPGVFQLTVLDTAASLAATAASVIAVTDNAIVTDSGPISAAVATQLAAISQAGKLTFQGGDQLIVQDSLSALINPANSGGLALASRIGVVDTATNLVAATAHNWGGVSPAYTLSQGGVINAAQAGTLAGLGSHFSDAGYTLSVSDTAAAALGASAALSSLGISASVADSAAHLGAQQSALLALAAITSVHVTDTTPVSAATASSMSGLAAKISGPPFHVADTAADVDGALSGLVSLGGHVAITITDSAANVGLVAADLATLNTTVSVVLTDLLPVTAGVAAQLHPIEGDLASGTTLAVSDTAAAIALNANALASLGGELGTLTLADGDTVGIATAASLAPLATHLAPGVMLTAVAFTAAAVTSSLSALESLANAGRLASVQVDPTSVADITSNAAALNALPTEVAVLDTPANVQAGLDSLAGIHGLQSISLQTNSTSNFTVSLATLGNDASVFSDIVSPYTITVDDTAGNIAHDLGLGSSSLILSNRSLISAISADHGQAVMLTQSQILAPGIDDGPSSALSVMTTPVDVTGVDVAHLGQVAALSHAPTGIAVTDTSSALAADLALGSTSSLLVNRALLTSITSSDGASVSLTAQQALSPHIDDAPHAPIALLQGASLAVSGANIAQLSLLNALEIPPASITVADTAGNLSADLASGSSALIAGLPGITAVSISDGGTITLTEAQLLATHVDDGAGSVLSEATGGHLAVTQAASGDLGMLLGLGVVPASLAINDTAAHVLSHLTSLEADIGNVAAITLTSGSLVLTAGEALAPHVDDGTGSIIDRLAGHAFTVTGASIAQLPALLALPDQPGSTAVSDSAANILADLTSGNSVLAADVAQIDSVTITHGTLSLTDAQANMILSTPGVDAVMAKLAPATVVAISGVPVGDIANLAGAGWPHLVMAVADTEANIAANLAGASPSLMADASQVASVTLTGDTTVNCATATELAALPQFSPGIHTMTVQDGAAAIAELGTPARVLASHIVVVDNTTNLGPSLDTLQAVYHGNLVINVVGNNGSIDITAAQYSADKPTIDAIAEGSNVIVSDTASQIAPLATQLAADPQIQQVNVSDTAANVIASLSGLQPAFSKIEAFLSDPSIGAVVLEQLLSQGSLNIASCQPVADTAAQVAALAESGNARFLSYILSNGALIQGSNVVSALDATALQNLAGFSAAPSSLIVSDTATHLSSPGYAAALNDSLVSAIYLKAAGGTVTVTAATLAALYGLPNFTSTNPDGSSNTLNVADTAAHIESNIAPLLMDVPGHVASVTVNASATTSAATIADLRSLGAVAGAGVQLNVFDTATAIASVAGGASSSITPASWLLSADGSVSEAQAVVLADLPGFNANGHILTLNLNANATISLSDAETLGNIAGALNLNGHHLIVRDTLAHLSTLSPSALALITPAVVDTLDNVAAIPVGSSLLHGTIEITDGGPATAAQAASIMAIASNLASAAVTIDHVHAVEDSIVNLRTLVSNSAWTTNAALQSSFTLAAHDTVQALTDPSNTAFLHGLSSSALLGDEATTAGSATTLASLQSTIHFNAGNGHITVTDSAAHLLDANNAPGLALANSVTLAGPEQLDAADTEQLLQVRNLSIITPVTVSDSSSNLLDGILGTQISSSGFSAHITVQLAGPETLDADTAASVVSLPGFADTHDLSIADSVSYLLNGANLSAEQMAATVTLDGDATVTAPTILRLSELPHFTPGTSHLALAGSDFADASTLKAIADEAGAVQVGAYNITMTQDDLNLSPAEYAALQADHVLTNGHEMGVTPGVVSLTDIGGMLSLSGQGIVGGTVHVYADSGTLITSNVSASGGFMVSAADSGHNFAITQSIGGVEGAPLVVLDAGVIETAVAGVGSTFSSIPGGIQIDPNKFLHLYDLGSVPQNLPNAALVYDPVAHTVSLDVAGSMTQLITLGGTTHPASLDPAEILIKHHG